MTAYKYLRIYDGRESVKSLYTSSIEEAYRLLSGESDPDPDPHVSKNSGNEEWYTPPEYIEAAREVMGGIDLDPASSAKANETVGAKHYFTKDDDGLSWDWFGRVWLNPPYSGKLVEAFAAKASEEYREGRIAAACILTNNATETKWFQNIAPDCAGICFPRGRIRYLDESGEEQKTPLQGQVILYLGKDGDAFRENFTPFGLTL